MARQNECGPSERGQDAHSGALRPSETPLVPLGRQEADLSRTLELMKRSDESRPGGTSASYEASWRKYEVRVHVLG